MSNFVGRFVVSWGKGEKMLKIVVFDSGWGGELVADYLEKELGVVEVTRVIDWANAPYEGKTLMEITDLAECQLKDYIGKFDVVVLGGYLVSLALETLKQRHPEQKFVGLGVNYDLILRGRGYPERVVVLMDDLLNDSALRQELRQKLLYSTLILPDCSGWENLINCDAMTVETLRSELAWDFRVLQRRSRRLKKSEDLKSKITLHDKAIIRAALNNLNRLSVVASEDADMIVPDDTSRQQPASEKIKPDLVLLLNTHFWEIKTEIEEVFGWNVRVLDFREKLLHDVCASLKLRGVHGRRSK